MKSTCTLAAGLALLLTGVALAAKPVKPTNTWSGVEKTNPALEKEAPPNGFLTDAAAFEKLWKAWRPTEAVPKVDFAKEVVLVSTASGPNKVFLTATLEDNGDLKVAAAATKIGGPGFGYALATVPLEGIKTVGGKPLK